MGTRFHDRWFTRVNFSNVCYEPSLLQLGHRCRAAVRGNVRRLCKPALQSSRRTFPHRCKMFFQLCGLRCSPCRKATGRVELILGRRFDRPGRLDGLRSLTDRPIRPCRYLLRLRLHDQVWRLVGRREGRYLRQRCRWSWGSRVHKWNGRPRGDARRCGWNRTWRLRSSGDRRLWTIVVKSRLSGGRG